MRFDSEGNLLPEIGQAEELAQEAPPLAASGAISAEQLAEFEAAFSDSPPESEHVAPSVPSAVTAVGEPSDGAAPLDQQEAPYGYNFLGYPRKHPEPSEAASRQVLMARGFNLSDDECKRLLHGYDNGREDDPWYDTGGES